MHVQVFIFLISLVLISYLMLEKGVRVGAGDYVGRVCGWDLDTATPTLITSDQTPAPNYVTSVRWQRPTRVIMVSLLFNGRKWIYRYIQSRVINHFVNVYISCLLMNAKYGDFKLNVTILSNLKQFFFFCCFFYKT